MAARRLVLNGLTAEVPAAAAPAPADEPDELEFYHELELYRQLLALTPAPPAPPAVLASPERRAITPEPASALVRQEPAPRRSRTPAPAARTPPPAALARARAASYLGSFPVEDAAGESGAGGEGGVVGSAGLADRLRLMKESGRAEPVLVVVAVSGLQVLAPEDQSVRMSHALRRIVSASCDGRALFAVVAREPSPRARAAPAPAPRTYCHAFQTETPEQAEELNSLLGDAFRMAFASQLHPSAPLWSQEVSGAGGECPAARAPDSLPGLPAHYPPGHRSTTRCTSNRVPGMGPAASPSSSEESCSPTEVSSYRRLGDRPPLMRRLARGLSGARLLPSDDDSTPLVPDTPTTPTNLPLCISGGGYINEASEAEARTRESNRERLPAPPLPAPPAPSPRRVDNMHDVEDFRRCINLKNGGSAACSRTTSSSSGASSCGGSHASGNNNIPRAEPELRQAPWFQHGIPREIALEVLCSQPVGAFLVRGSTTQAGCYALSVRVPRDFQPSGIAHYLILRTPKGYKIKGFTKEFTSLCALVTHHSVMPELLPVPLHLPRAAGRARRDHADIDAVAPAPPPVPPAHILASYLKQLDV